MQRWAAEVGPAVAKQAQELAETVRSQVQGDVPVLTGTLAASVTTTEDAEGVGVGYDPDIPYAGYIEFGGFHGRDLVPEGRYLYPTATAAEPDYQALASNVAEDTARRFPWSTPPTAS
jgi:phage gpG-like protein